MSKDSTIISALHLKYGDIIALYGRTFLVVGKYEICYSDCSYPRVLLISCSNSSFITFLGPSDKLYKTSSNIFVPYEKSSIKSTKRR